MQSEYDALASELTNIIGNTSFGGAKLLNSTAVAADNTVALANLAARTTDKLAAEAKLGTQNTYSAPGTIATTGTAGSAQNYSIATDAWKVASAAATPDPVDIAAKFQAMIGAKQTMDKDADALAKATTAEVAAQNHSTATTNAMGGDAGKFSAELKFQIGSSSGETMALDLSSQVSSMHTSLRGVSTLYNAFGSTNAGTGAELTGVNTANATVDKLQDAIDSLGTVRSALGAATNRLDHVATNLANVSTNTEAAAGRIMDVDFATESSKMTSNQMLMQAGTAMLKQTNQMSSMVMSLLQ
jgi:flagellin